MFKEEGLEKRSLQLGAISDRSQKSEAHPDNTNDFKPLLGRLRNPANPAQHQESARPDSEAHTDKPKPRYAGFPVETVSALDINQDLTSHLNSEIKKQLLELDSARLSYSREVSTQEGKSMFSKLVDAYHYGIGQEHPFLTAARIEVDNNETKLQNLISLRNDLIKGRLDSLNNIRDNGHIVGADKPLRVANNKAFESILGGRTADKTTLNA